MNEWKHSREIRLREGVAFIMYFKNFLLLEFFYDYVLPLLFKIICNRTTNSVFGFEKMFIKV